MFRRILSIDYDALSEFLIYNADLIGDDPNFLEFENICAYLKRETEVIMAFPEELDGEYVDIDLIKILSEDLDFDTIINITVTSTPGIVKRVGNHLLKLPIILIETEY